MRQLVLAIAIASTVSSAALAADSPFSGTWKLTIAKSQFTGDTFELSKSAKGIHFYDGAVAYDFAIDGRTYPTIPGRTVSWSKTGANAWNTTTMSSGKLISKTRKTLSTDGSTLSTDWTEFRPDGTTGHGSTIYKRISGSSGLVGKWKDMKVQTTQDVLKISVPTAGHFEMVSPIYKSVVTGATDGTPASVQGPTIPPSAAARYKAEGTNTWDYAFTLSGKPYENGKLSVSPDGKTLTDTSWTPGKESERSISVYDKS